MASLEIYKRFCACIPLSLIHGLLESRRSQWTGVETLQSVRLNALQVWLSIFAIIRLHDLEGLLSSSVRGVLKGEKLINLGLEH